MFVFVLLYCIDCTKNVSVESWTCAEYVEMSICSTCATRVASLVGCLHHFGVKLRKERLRRGIIMW